MKRISLYEGLSCIKLQISDFLLNHNRLLEKMLNNNGPWIDPGGTPKKILNHKLKEEPI